MQATISGIWQLFLADVHLSSEFVNSILAFVTALSAAGAGTWILKALADRRSARMADEAGDADRKRAERKDVVTYYESLMERMRADHDRMRQLWDKEREGTIRERDRIRSDYYALREEAAQMRDRLAAMSGLGSEGIERMDPVVVMNDSGIICWLNDPACAFLGYRPTEILGQPIFKIIPSKRHAYVRGVLLAQTEKLLGLPDWQPIKHLESGVVMRRDESTMPIEVVINGFRVPCRFPAPKGTETNWIPTFRVHLRPRWTSTVTTVNMPDVTLNSADGFSDLTTGDPSQSDSDENLPKVPNK